MSLFTENMRLLTAVVIEKKSDEVVKALLSIGALDFVQITNLPPDQLAKLSKKRPNSDRLAIEDTRRRIDNLLRQSGSTLPNSSLLKVEDMVSLDIKGYRNILDEFSSSISEIKEQQKTLNQRYEILSEIKRYLETDKTDFVEIRVGNTKTDIEKIKKRLSDFGSLIVKTDQYIATLSLKRDTANISQVLNMVGWIESEDSLIQKEGTKLVRQELNTQIDNINKEKEDLEFTIREKIQEKEPLLINIWCNLRLHELSDQIRSYFKYTKNTTLFSGWVPKKFSDQVASAIYQATDGECIIDQSDPSSNEIKDIPVEVTTPKFFKPFEKMVTNYGIPEYGTINPTWFVTVAYLSMFMLMFADLGQGFVLLLIGLLTHHSYKKHPMKKDSIINRNVSVLLIYLGVASMIGGVIFGSTFGFSLIPPLWFNYHSVVLGTAQLGTPVQNVYDILGITIIYGIVIIFVGLLINWVNLIIKKDYIEMLFARTGLAGAMMYSVGIYIGYSYIMSGYKTFPTDNWILILLIIGALCLLIKEPLEYLKHKRSGKKVESVGAMVSNTLMMWPIELLETFTGYMSNTLSFMRVAGLGIAHVSLMGAFETLAEGPGMTSVFGILILIFGNVLVIALEGLSSGIQSLRLNYYEFFTKFFNGKGIAYSPVSLRSSER
ncbi:MAG: V-type ATPase 116kDa subunit family protein [Sphaerochaetaceae bacterium]|nr:V-type ATPase 116kDa subunit family protein [Sphaerochaetaceae bacterium]MDC7249460.1 V-type ATPase 116kDa subunit family protein [Sphaerochaetaceae bacterium]